jgi:hypothetical protein
MNEGYTPRSEKMQSPQMLALGLDPFAMQVIDESFLDYEIKYKTLEDDNKSVVVCNALVVEESRIKSERLKVLENTNRQMLSRLYEVEEEDPQ